MTEERADNKGTVVSDNGNQKPLVDEKCGLMHFKDFSPANPPTLQSTLWCLPHSNKKVLNLRAIRRLEELEVHTKNSGCPREARRLRIHLECVMQTVAYKWTRF